MKTIEETASEKFPKVIDQDGFDNNKEGHAAYIEGAKDVLNEVTMTISVSTEEYLRKNLLELISQLKGNYANEDN